MTDENDKNVTKLGRKYTPPNTKQQSTLTAVAQLMQDGHMSCMEALVEDFHSALAILHEHDAAFPTLEPVGGETVIGIGVTGDIVQRFRLRRDAVRGYSEFYFESKGSRKYTLVYKQGPNAGTVFDGFCDAAAQTHPGFKRIILGVFNNPNDANTLEYFLQLHLWRKGHAVYGRDGATPPIELPFTAPDYVSSPRCMWCPWLQGSTNTAV